MWSAFSSNLASSVAVPRLRAAAAAAAIWTAGASGVSAIVINDGDAGQDLALGLAFPSVAKIEIDVPPAGGSFGICSGALISATHVLSADHCFDEADTNYAPLTQVKFPAASGNVGGINQPSPGGTFGVTSILRMAPSSAGFGQLLNGADLAILTLDAPVLDRDPFLVLNEPLAALDETAVLAGFGRFGLGSAGPGGATSNATRAARQVVEFYGAAKAVGTQTTTGPGGVTTSQFLGDIPGTENIYTTDFDNPDNPPEGDTFGLAIPFNAALVADAEGTTAGGDSGGPLLVMINGEWVVAGALSGGTSTSSQFGDLSYWTGTGAPAALAFISANSDARFSSEIPIPASGSLLLLGVAGMAALRRRRGAARKT